MPAPIVLLEIRISKFETNINSLNINVQNFILYFCYLNFGYCFVFRISGFEFILLRLGLTTIALSVWWLWKKRRIGIFGEEMKSSTGLTGLICNMALAADNDFPQLGCKIVSIDFLEAVSFACLHELADVVVSFSWRC